MSDTPLSDLMTAHADSGDPESYAQFVKLFQESVVGVVGIGTVAPDAQGHLATGPGFAVGRTTHGDGKARILTFADPDTASQVPGSQCNTGLLGRVLLQMAAADPQCEGVLVNSATSQTSLVISKATAQSTTDGATTTRKSWWKRR